MTAFLRDVGQAIRTCRRTPLFSAGVIIVLALGIGANGAVFSILRAVLLQPLPYQSPERIVMLWQASNYATNWRMGTTKTAVMAWHEQSSEVLDDVASLKLGQNGAQFDLILADHAERLNGAMVSPNFFHVLGVTAEQGRLFDSRDDATGAGDLLVISHALWERAFGGDPSVVGRTVSLTPLRKISRPFTIVGVLPEAFHFTYPESTELWALQPWADVRAESGGIQFNGAIGRLKPGVTLEQAQARMAPVGIPTTLANLSGDNHVYTRLESIEHWVVGETRPSLILLGAVALLLLVITCATVANALFVRVTERQRELAVRTSLGASRNQIMRLVVAEGSVLSVAGALVGTFLAAGIQPALRALIPPTVPRGTDVGADFWLVAFGALIAFLVMILSTALPAWRSHRVDVVSTLKRASSTASPDRSSARLREGLLAFQAGMATTLLVSATLLLISFWRLNHVPLGFSADKVLTVEMRLYDRKFETAASRLQLQDALATRVLAVPGVREVGLTSAVPFRGIDALLAFDRPNGQRVNGNGRYVDAAYFAVMHVPLLRGRLFDQTDTATSAKVIVVSDAFARIMFGTGDPIGRMVDDPARQVVGVVGDLRYAALDRDPYPAVYFPRTQTPDFRVCLVVRTSPEAANVGPSIRAAIHDVDPSLPAMNMTTIDTIISESVSNRRFFTTATVAFAGLALLLTLVGLAVIVARAVVERRREMAIRAALGAPSRRLVGLVVGQGLGPVALGTTIGLVAAFWGSTLLSQFLFGVVPRTPAVYVGVALFVMVVALAACLVPARRVTTVAPASVLRAE